MREDPAVGVCERCRVGPSKNACKKNKVCFRAIFSYGNRVNAASAPDSYIHVGVSDTLKHSLSHFFSLGLWLALLPARRPQEVIEPLGDRVVASHALVMHLQHAPLEQPAAQCTFQDLS
jgi:hypothetical protein